MSDVTLFYAKRIVGDADALARFYCDVFGMNEVRRFEGPAGEEPHLEIFLSAGSNESDTQVALMQWPNRPTPKPGEAAIAFMVKDVDAIVAAALARGGACTRAAETMKEYKFRWGVIADPEGHSIELMSYLA